MRLKDVIAKNVLGTYIMFIACLENFLQVLKVERGTLLISFWSHVRYFVKFREVEFLFETSKKIKLFAFCSTTRDPRTL